MLHTAGRADALVAAEHNQRFETLLIRAFRVSETVFERVLRREERDDARSRHVAPHVADEVAKVVLLLETHGAVGQEHECPIPREAFHGVVRVNPGIHARGRGQLRPWRPELRGDDRRGGFQTFEQSGHAAD
jgi:hypothetical protein